MPAETKSVIESAIRACEKAGAKLTEGWPKGFSLPEMYDTYLFLLAAFDFSVMPAPRQQQVRALYEQRSDPFAKSGLTSLAAWQGHNMRRLAYRAL